MPPRPARWLSSAPGTVIGLLLGLALGSKALEWLGVLFDAVS